MVIYLKNVLTEEVTNKGKNAVSNLKISIVVAYNGGGMFMRKNTLTGNEIKGNYVNSDKFSVSQWLQAG